MDFGLNELENSLKAGIGVPSQLTGRPITLSEHEIGGGFDIPTEASMFGAPSDITPKEQAERNILQRETGIPVEDKQTKLDVQKNKELDELEKLLLGAPTTKSFLSTPENYAVAKESSSVLAGIETLVRTFKGGQDQKEANRMSTEARDQPSLKEEARLFELRSRLLKQKEDAGGFIGWLSESAEVVGQMSDMFMQPETWALIGAGAAGGALQGVRFGPKGALIGAAIGGGLALRVATARDSYISEGGDAYAEYREAGINRQEAAVLSIGVGIINAGLEVASLSVLLKPFEKAGGALLRKSIKDAVKAPKVRNLVREAITAYGTGIFTEVTTEVMQEIVNIAGGEIGKLMQDKEGITAEEFQNRITEIAIKTFKAMTVLGVPGPGINLAVQAKRSRDAKENKEILDRVSDLAQESDLAKLDPVKSAEHVASVLEDVGRSELFIPGDKLKEWAVNTGDPDILKKLNVKEEELEDAVQEGTDVTINSKEFSQFILHHEKYKDISEHIRLNEDGLTVFEAEELIETGIEKAIEKETTFAPPQKENEAIAVAEDELGLRGIFRSAQEAGMTEREYTDYLKNIETQRFEATKKMEDVRLAREQRKLTREWKAEEQEVRTEVIEHLNGVQVYSAFHGIQRDRLNRTQVEQIAKEQGFKIEDLPTQSKQRAIFTTEKNEQGVDVETHAHLYGYSSATDMLLDMVTSKPFNEAVDSTTNAVMNERHGDLKNRSQAVIEARRILHDTKYSSVLETELNSMRALMKQRKLTPSILRKAAKAKIYSYVIKNIRVDKFLTAERQNGKKAGIALRKGDIKAAEEFKFKQLLNYYMAAEAYKVRDLVETRVAELKRIADFKPRGEKLPVLYQKAINEVLDRVNLLNRISIPTTDALKTLSEKNVDRPQISEALLQGYTKPYYKDMTLSEFTDIFITVRDIQKRGLEENKFRLETEQKDVNEKKTIVIKAIEENLITKPDLTEVNDFLHARQFGRQYAVLAFNIHTLMTKLDGFKELGVVYRTILDPYMKAMSHGYQPGQRGYLRENEKLNQDLIRMFKKAFTKKERIDFNKPLNIPGVTKPLTLNKLITAMLNMGNKEGYQSLIDGNGFTEAELNAIKNNTKEIPKRHWDFVQEVLDYNESFWPAVKKAEERRRNYTPEKVEAQPIETAYGTYKGGFYHLKYDKHMAIKLGKFDQVKKEYSDNDELKDAYERALHGGHIAKHTKRDHTIARKENVGLPILLDIFTLRQHLHGVIYDLEVGDALNDVRKVLLSPEVAQAFYNKGYKHYHDYLELWFRDVVTEKFFMDNIFENAMRHIRTGYTFSKLLYNVAVQALQILGILQGAVKVGQGNFIKGAGRVLASATKLSKDSIMYAIYTIAQSDNAGKYNMWEYVRKQSGFMDSRFENSNNEIVEAQKFFHTTVLDKMLPGNTAEVVRRSGFWLLLFTQNITDVVIFLAAKKQGLEVFGNEKDAITFAEKAVIESQGSNVFGARTPFERGSFHKNVPQSEGIRAMAQFMSFFAAKTNLIIAESGKLAKTTRESKLKGLAMLPGYALNVFVLIVLDTYLAAFLTGKLPDSEDDEFLPALWEEIKGAAFAGLPVARDVFSEIRGFRGGGAGAQFVFRDIPALMEQTGKVLKEYIDNGQFDLNEKLTKTIINVLGIFTRLPAAQINKSFTTSLRAEEGHDMSVGEFMFGPNFEHKR